MSDHGPILVLIIFGHAIAFWIGWRLGDLYMEWRDKRK